MSDLTIEKITSQEFTLDNLIEIFENEKENFKIKYGGNDNKELRYEICRKNFLVLIFV